MATSRSQIGGANVAVTSILSNPDQDPHLFEASPSVARATSTARIVIYNGVDYDPWMDKLLARLACAGPHATSWSPTLVGHKTGDNPHLWYDPATMPAVRHGAGRRAGRGRSGARGRLPTGAQAQFLSVAAADRRQDRGDARQASPARRSPRPSRCSAIWRRARPEGAQRGFQLAVMNNTEPSASDVAAFENDLKDHKVQAAALQQPGERHRRRSGWWNWPRQRHPGRRRDRNRAAGKTYQDWMLERARRASTRRFRRGLVNAPSHSTTSTDRSARRDVLAGVELRDRRRRIRRRARRRTAPARPR